MSAGMEISYSHPIKALPPNQANPYPLLKMPYTVARRLCGAMPTTAARMIDS